VRQRCCQLDLHVPDGSREDDCIKVHRELAKFFLTDVVDETRRCDELGWHLAQCDDAQGLRSFLANVRHFDLLSSNAYSSFDLWTLWREANVSHAGRM